MNYPRQIHIALQKIREAGFESYLVGGCVRDFLIGRMISDYDISCSARPEEVKEVFCEYPLSFVGEKHGTVGVLIDGEWIEITTFRADGEYKDGRRPEQVFFTRSLKEDLVRRDFTVNAIAYSSQSGIVDLLGGREDLSNRLIRAVGNPTERFQEDALRILRAVRLASQLDFVIEENTLSAMRECLFLLEKISAERKAVELIKTLQGQAIERVLLDYTEIFASILPDLLLMNGFDQNNPHHIYDVLTHTAKVVANTPNDRALRLAALFHDIGKVHSYTVDEQGIGHFYGHGKISEQIAEKTLRSLKLDKQTVDEVLLLVKYHDAQIEPNKKIIKRWLCRLGKDLFFKLLLLKRADNLAQSPCFNRQKEIDEIEHLAKKVIDELECFSLKDLSVNGHDLIALGLRGKQIGEILNELLVGVMDETLPNGRAALLNKVQEIQMRKESYDQ